MKTDFFSAFRKPYIHQKARNVCNDVTEGERANEIKELQPNGAVTTHTQGGVTSVTEPPPGYTVTNPSHDVVTGLRSENLEQNQGNSTTVTLLQGLQPKTDTTRRDVAPDSRHPLVVPEVRAKIEAIEAEARGKGWPAELLWSCACWDLPRGLAAVLEPGDEIGAITSDAIEILRMKRNVLRFRRYAA